MFKIVTTGKAILQHHMNKTVAGADARRTMENNIRLQTFKLSGQSVRNGGLVFDDTMVDRADASKNLRDYQRNYDNTAPESLSPEQKSALWKRAKELKDRFTSGMLSKNDIHPVKAYEVNGKINVVVDEEKMRTNRCIERNNAWYQRNVDGINEYKNILRQLCPKDANASLEDQLSMEKNFTDIEKFRPVGNGK